MGETLREHQHVSEGLASEFRSFRAQNTGSGFGHFRGAGGIGVDSIGDERGVILQDSMHIDEPQFFRGG